MFQSIKTVPFSEQKIVIGYGKTKIGTKVEDSHAGSYTAKT